MAYANALFIAAKETQAPGLMRHAPNRWPRDPVVFAIAASTAASAGKFTFVDQVMQESPVARFPADAQRLIAPVLGEDRKDNGCFLDDQEVLARSKVWSMFGEERTIRRQRSSRREDGG